MQDEPAAGSTVVPGPNTQRGGAVVWLATGFGLGYSPYAPGTVGAVWGLPLAWAIGEIPWVAVQVLAIVAIAAVGIPICGQGAKRLGGAKDPGAVVFDEIAALPITFFLIPIDGIEVVVAGFLLSRLCDITKPPPARQLERLPGGLGIMADDLMAAVYSNLLLRLVIWVLQ